MKTRLKLGPFEEYLVDFRDHLRELPPLVDRFNTLMRSNKIMDGEKDLPALKSIFMCFHSRLLKTVLKVDQIESAISDIWDSIEWDSGHGGDLWDLMPLDLIKKEEPLAIFGNREPILYMKKTVARIEAMSNKELVEAAKRFVGNGSDDQ
jgi:hypothetical protein